MHSHIDIVLQPLGFITNAPSGTSGSVGSASNSGQVTPNTTAPLQQHSQVQQQSHQQQSHQQQSHQQQSHQQQSHQQQSHQQHAQQQQQQQHSSTSFYADTSNMYGTPLSLLQLPPSALPEITNKLNQFGISSVRFMQDGRNIDELRCVISDLDFKMINESDVEVGFTCKKCHMTYPAEVLCLGHQRASCFAKQSSDIKATLKLVQIYIECRACHEKFASIIEYKFHCDCDRHIKRTQKYEMTTNTTTTTTTSTTAITTNGGSTPDTQSNNLTDIATLFMNGNDANLINYLNKNMNVNAIAFSNMSDASH